MLLLIFLATLAIALLAQWQVKRMHRRFSQVAATSGYTGAEAAQAILREAGIRDVEILEHDEMLGDHYDPRHKRLVLSSQNYHGTSLAALGVAAHEAGHALQHQAAYAPLHLRMAAGLLSTVMGLTVMAVAWGAIMAFNLITLPVEFDASRRAKAMLGNMGFISGHAEHAGVSKVLNAAAMTYVAAFVTSLVYLLWYLLPLLTGSRQR